LAASSAREKGGGEEDSNAKVRDGDLNGQLPWATTGGAPAKGEPPGLFG